MASAYPIPAARQDPWQATARTDPWQAANPADVLARAEAMGVLSPRLFGPLAELIQAHTGIKMPQSKQTMLEGRLRRGARTGGFATIDDYCAALLAHDVSDEDIDGLINAVTTNKTDFFRESRQFDYLRDHILPAWLRDGKRGLRCWSAACSTGAEPYTLAMVFDDFAARHRGPDYRILATDLDTQVLDTAHKGCYPSEMADPIPPALRKRYVLESRDPDRDEIRIVPELRRRVSFARLNFMDEKYPIGEAVDLIFCRNVLIYFDKPTQTAVVKRLCEQLKPGGYLFLGHSESISGFEGVLRSVSGTIFVKL